MKKAIIIAVVALIGLGLLGGCGGGVVYAGSTYNTRVTHENGLGTQYVMNQNDLGQYVLGLQEQFGAYGMFSDDAETFMVNTVKGRYDIKGPDGKPTGEIDEVYFKNELNVLVEAYPELSWMSEMATDILDYIRAERAEFKNNQDKLLVMLNAYDNWRQKFPAVVVLALMGGTPSDKLVARVGETAFTGQSAYNQMWKIILPSGMDETFLSGEMAPVVPDR